jgi:hypothetical protein
MMTLGHSESSTEEIEDSFVPCLVIETVPEDKLLPTPVFPRASPLKQVPEALYCEGYSGLDPRRYCKETLLRVQRLVESRGL